jgi:hypothetical protein
LQVIPPFLSAMSMEIISGRFRLSMARPCTGIPLRRDRSEDYISRVRCMPLSLSRHFCEDDLLFKTASA